MPAPSMRRDNRDGDSRGMPEISKSAEAVKRPDNHLSGLDSLESLKTVTIAGTWSQARLPRDRGPTTIGPQLAAGLP